MADVLQAENSEAFQIVSQHTEMLRSYLHQFKNYLTYLYSENVSADAIARIQANADAIESALEEIENDARKESIDSYKKAEKKAAKKDADYQQYESAYKLYEQGQVKRALSKFKLLAQTTDNTVIKNNAHKSIELIEGHDWGENGVPE